MALDLSQLFAEAARLGASDLHLVVGFPPTLRVDGKLTPIAAEALLTDETARGIILPSLSAEQKEELETNRELDFSLATPVGRFRVNAYFQKGTLAASYRLIAGKIRTMNELGLPEICNEFVKLRQGLVLVTGPTGHGKSTTLAAMINFINGSRAAHIITVEDPVEYVYPPALSVVSQREMHGDTHSWNMALRSVLREDPDVVLIGEMRDFETIQATLTIAETGHLVFATLHTNSAAQTVDRIIDVFPENQQTQVRLQLSLILEGVISQRLMPALTGGRVVAAEILTATAAIKTLIREGKTHQIDSTIQTSAEYGMMTLEMALAKLVKAGKINVETATAYAIRPEELGKVLKMQR